MVFPLNFLNSKYYHNLTIFRVILNFAQECYYLENKVGVVDFTKAHGLVKFQIFEVKYHYTKILLAEAKHTKKIRRNE